MDKREFNIKVEQIKKRVNEGDYETAMKIADAIDWRRVRNTNLLSMVAQIYEKNGEYGEAKNILLLAFERAPIGKRLLYKLTDLALKENNIDEAEDYYREFCDLAPEDTRQHLLRYMILRAKGAPAEQLIHSLEQYTAEELDEKWMYELALLYHQTGRGSDCVRLCDRIMLMFGIGKYVDKAMELKLQYAPLTSYQQDLVDHRDKYEAKLRAVEEEYGGGFAQDRQPASDPQYNGGYDGAGQYGETYGDGQYAADSYNGNQYGEDQYAGAYASGQYAGDSYGQYSADPYAGSGESSYQQGPETGSLHAGPVIEEEAPGEYEPEEDRVYQNGREQAASQAAAAEAEYEAAKEAYQADPRGIYEEAPRMYDGHLSREEENNSQPAAGGRENDTPAPSIDQVLEAKMREAQEQENLAREMARLAPEEESETDDRLAKTKVLKNIRDVLPNSGGVTKTPEEDGQDRAPVIQKIVPAAEEPKEETGESAQPEPVCEPEEQVREPEEPVQEPEPAPQTEVREREIPAPAAEEPVPVQQEERSAEEPEQNHLMIEAAVPEKGLELALSTLKQIHRELGIKRPVAKISGKKLSEKGLMSVAAKLTGRDFVVEGAGDIVQPVLDELNDFMAQDQGKTIVVLIDTPEKIEKLHRQNPELAGRFECIGTGAEPDMSDVEAAIQKQADREAAIARKEAEEAARREAEEKARREEAARQEAEEKARKEAEEAARREAEEKAHRDEVRRAALETIAQTAASQGDIEEYTQTDWNGDDQEAEEMLEQDYYEDDGDYEEPEEEVVESDEDDEEEMDIDEFAQYACKYASDIDCSITGKSMLALYERIEIMEEEGIPLTKRHAEDLIEEAADKAEKPSLGKRITNLFSSKYDKNGLLILKEEHFIE